MDARQGSSPLSKIGDRNSYELCCVDYARVMDSLPENVQRVAIRAAFLPRLTCQSAAEITGDPEAGRILDGLADRFPLLVREPGRQITYKYRSPFRTYARELARASLPGEELQKLLWRAAELMERELVGGTSPSYELEATRSPAPPDVIHIRTLGGFCVLRDGKPIPKQRKAQAKPLALIKALVALGGEGIPAYRLADVLWPDADGDCALARFNATLHRARKLLGVCDAVVVREGLISLNRAVVACDVFEFEQIVAGIDRSDEPAQALGEKLLRSYPGTLLPEHSAEAWAQPCRARLAAKFTSAVLRLGERLQAEGKPHAAQALFLEAISREPLSFALEGFLSKGAKRKAS
jgi:DNA-binding SARP family transcriptional activator